MITHDIIGDDRQAVVITLAAGDEVRAEAGAMTRGSSAGKGSSCSASRAPATSSFTAAARSFRWN
jgi:uncharacterized protein (AIM24 family)